MAKIYLLILISTITFSVFAQDKTSAETPVVNELNADTFLAQGRYEAGGLFNFTSAASSGDSSLFVQPLFGYFIKDRLSLNAALGMSYSSASSKFSGAVTAGASYYFKLSGAIAPFVSQDFYRTYGSSDASEGGSTTFGALYFLRHNVALKSGLSYSYNFDESLNEGFFNVNSGLSFFF